MNVAYNGCDNYSLKTVEESFLGLCDKLNLDSENPFKDIIKKGNTVFIKPNWVAHEYRQSAKEIDDVFSTITHPSVIKVVAKYVDVALDGDGEIIIGDNPSIDCDFKELMKLQDLSSLHEELKTTVKILDLRPEWCDNLENYGIKHKMVKQEGDPKGVVKVNLGKDSKFFKINNKLFRGVYTDRTETIRRHSKDLQEYEFSASLANADVYISIPKMKTHHKVGTTLNLKGMVGTQANKNLLVHWRIGFPAIGGDEYSSFKEWFVYKFKKIKKRGAWAGNDTIWRMVVDLYNSFNKIRERKTFSVVDGIIGGDVNGPFYPRSKNSKVLIAGEDLLEVDLVTSRLMGFNIKKIPYLWNLVKEKKMNLSEISVLGQNKTDLGRILEKDELYFDYRTPTSWKLLKDFEET
ncbi:DUF362 domain-containing protein [Spirochaeta isovalerica]|uniref:Uncharacterized protein (DUF362 family) n=1 Tax=Spirochaeta isovalerica TaxID=150 RepID=A0A841RDP5_9SPIO|nr:DUF362 domain-containing protein [Spirochaeta isovalerica]MBB6480748.1 uncharacterized protein (DUF362 family) [Spirochaeta isovalerica]